MTTDEWLTALRGRIASRMVGYDPRGKHEDGYSKTALDAYAEGVRLVAVAEMPCYWQWFGKQRLPCADDSARTSCAPCTARIELDTRKAASVSPAAF